MAPNKNLRGQRLPRTGPQLSREDLASDAAYYQSLLAESNPSAFKPVTEWIGDALGPGGRVRHSRLDFKDFTNMLNDTGFCETHGTTADPLLECIGENQVEENSGRPASRWEKFKRELRHGDPDRQPGPVCFPPIDPDDPIPWWSISEKPRSHYDRKKLLFDESSTSSQVNDKIKNPDDKLEDHTYHVLKKKDSSLSINKNEKHAEGDEESAAHLFPKNNRGEDFEKGNDCEDNLGRDSTSKKSTKSSESFKKHGLTKQPSWWNFKLPSNPSTPTKSIDPLTASSPSTVVSPSQSLNPGCEYDDNGTEASTPTTPITPAKSIPWLGRRNVSEETVLSPTRSSKRGLTIVHTSHDSAIGVNGGQGPIVEGRGSDAHPLYGLGIEDDEDEMMMQPRSRGLSLMEFLNSERVDDAGGYHSQSTRSTSLPSTTFLNPRAVPDPVDSTPKLAGLTHKTPVLTRASKSTISLASFPPPQPPPAYPPPPIPTLPTPASLIPTLPNPASPFTAVHADAKEKACIGLAARCSREAKTVFSPAPEGPEEIVESELGSMAPLEPIKSTPATRKYKKFKKQQKKSEWSLRAKTSTEVIRKWGRSASAFSHTRPESFQMPHNKPCDGYPSVNRPSSKEVELMDLEPLRAKFNLGRRLHAPLWGGIHPNHSFDWNTKNLWCAQCIVPPAAAQDYEERLAKMKGPKKLTAKEVRPHLERSTPTECACCSAPCCLWAKHHLYLYQTAIPPPGSDKPNIIPKDPDFRRDIIRCRLKTHAMLCTIESSCKFGREPSTFVTCNECGRVVCPRCAGQCRDKSCLLIVCMTCAPKPWEKCDLHKRESSSFEEKPSKEINTERTTLFDGTAWNCENPRIDKLPAAPSGKHWKYPAYCDGV